MELKKEVEHETLAAQDQAMQAEFTKLDTEEKALDKIDDEISDENREIRWKHQETVENAKSILNQIR